MPFGDKLTAPQKAELKRRNSLILDNEEVERQGFACWHNPRTGQEFPHLPTDPFNLATYWNKGFRPGRAPAELREEWATNEPKRQRAFDARRKKAQKDPEFADELAEAKEQAEAVPAAEVAEIAKQAAQEAVAEVLRQLGVPASALPAAVTEQPSAEAAEAEETEPKQLRML